MNYKLSDIFRSDTDNIDLLIDDINNNKIKEELLNKLFMPDEHDTYEYKLFSTYSIDKLKRYI